MTILYYVLYQLRHEVGVLLEKLIYNLNYKTTKSWREEYFAVG